MIILWAFYGAILIIFIENEFSIMKRHVYTFKIMSIFSQNKIEKIFSEFR